MKGRGGKRPIKPEIEEANPYPMLQITPESQLRSESVNEVLQAVFHYRFGPSLSLEAESGSGFVFEGEAHYEALGSYVTAFVFCILKEICGLMETWLPANHPQYCVFQSPDWTSNTSKAMVLIPGKGKVGLGLWSRKICTNDGLNAGSMLSYVTRAQAEGYSILVMNCNARTSTITSNESNAEATWRACMPRCKAGSVYIVAHSWGGKCTLQLLRTCFSDISKRVVGIAFTDSVHKTVVDLPRPAADFLKSKAVNWVKSTKPVDQQVADKIRAKDGCENRSAGTMVHEYTSSSAIDCVFGYLGTCVRRVPVRPGLRPR